MGIMRKTRCLVVSPILVNSYEYALHFNCTTEGLFSDCRTCRQKPFFRESMPGVCYDTGQADEY